MKLFKTLVLILVLSMIHTETIAQSEVTQLKSREIGFNANPILSNLLPFEDSFSMTTKDISFFYKPRIKNLTYLRTGFSISATVESLSPSSDADAFGLVKLGVEKKNMLTNSLIFYYGADLFFTLSSSEIGDLDRIEGGVDGVYGFQWLINQRMSFSTEGYLSVSYLEEKNLGSNTEGIRAGILIPRSLYFSVFF